MIIVIDDSFWGEMVYGVEALNYGYLKTNVFAVAKVFTISNKMEESIIRRVLF